MKHSLGYRLARLRSIDRRNMENWRKRRILQLPTKTIMDRNAVIGRELNRVEGLLKSAN